MAVLKAFSEKSHGCTKAGAEIILRIFEHPDKRYVRALGDSTRTLDVLIREGFVALAPVYSEEDRAAFERQHLLAAAEVKDMLPDNYVGAYMALKIIMEERARLNDKVYRLSEKGLRAAQSLRDYGYTYDYLRYGV
jgi:hypothetical protein